MNRVLGKIVAVVAVIFLMGVVGLVAPVNAATQRECEEAGYSYSNGTCYDPNSARISATASSSTVLAFQRNTCQGQIAKVGSYIYCAINIDGGGGGTGGGGSDGGGSDGGESSSGSAEEQVKDVINNLPNNGNGITSDFLRNILNWIYALAGLVAVVMIIYGGIKYNTAQGDPGKVKQAGQIIAFSIIGLVIVLLAAAITAFATGAIGGAV